MPRINRGITGGEGSDAIQPDGGTEAHMPYRRVIGSEAGGTADGAEAHGFRGNLTEDDAEAHGTVARGDGDDAEAHLDRSGR